MDPHNVVLPGFRQWGNFGILNSVEIVKGAACCNLRLGSIGISGSKYAPYGLDNGNASRGMTRVDQENKHASLIGANQSPVNSVYPPSQICSGYGHLAYKTELYGAPVESFQGIGAELLRIETGSSTPSSHR